MKARATRPVSVKGNEIGEAVLVADENPTTFLLSYCGAAQPLQFAWQGLAMMPPRVETHATTQPSVRDTLRETEASNCKAENANAPPQSMVIAATQMEKCEWRGSNGIEIIVAYSIYGGLTSCPYYYALPLARLWVLQSIWQLASLVSPPFDHAVTWSASISLKS